MVDPEVRLRQRRWWRANVVVDGQRRAVEASVGGPRRWRRVRATVDGLGVASGGRAKA